MEEGIWARDLGHRRASCEEEGGGEGDASRSQSAPKTAGHQNQEEAWDSLSPTPPTPALVGTSPADTITLDLPWPSSLQRHGAVRSWAWMPRLSQRAPGEPRHTDPLLRWQRAPGEPWARAALFCMPPPLSLLSSHRCSAPPLGPAVLLGQHLCLRVLSAVSSLLKNFLGGPTTWHVGS